MNKPGMPVEAVAAYLRLVEVEARLAVRRANVLEAENVGVPEIKSFELLRLRLRREAIDPPRMFSRSSTKRRYVAAMNLLDEEQQAILDATEAALDALAEVNKIRADLIGYVRAKIARESPAVVACAAPWLGDAEVLRQAHTHNCQIGVTLSYTEPMIFNRART